MNLPVNHRRAVLLKVMTFNANGIRSAAKKGFFEWFLGTHTDVLCVQETKAQREQLNDPIFHPEGFFYYHSDAIKKGYSGVGIYTRIKPVRVIHELGLPWADQEGRYLQVDLPIDGQILSIVSLYLPSGSSGEERQSYKWNFMDFYQKKLAQMMEASKKENQAFVLCGDWNIVHTEKDIKNFKGNQKSSGCLPEERKWLDDTLVKLGWVDAFRVLNQQPEEYTWWSQRGRARAHNVGWRIDYQLITPNLKDRIKNVEIYRDEIFSDHAPFCVEYQALV